MRPISIIHVPDLDGNPTPARCNRRTGEIWINDSQWKNIKPEHRMFILLHEYGHIQLDSSDELAVDAYASDLYIKMGYSLTESVKALSQILTGTNSQHVQRVQNQLDRAKAIDAKNKPKILSEMINNDYNNVPWYDRTESDVDVTDNYDEIFGLGKKAQARKKERQDAKNYARRARADAKGTIAESKLVKAQAKAVLADQGIVDSSSIGGALGGIAGNLLGGGGTQTDPLSATPPPPKKSNKTTIIIVSVIAAVVVIGGVLFFVMKRKKS